MHLNYDYHTDDFKFLGLFEIMVTTGYTIINVSIPIMIYVLLVL